MRLPTLLAAAMVSVSSASAPRQSVKQQRVDFCDLQKAASMSRRFVIPSWKEVQKVNEISNNTTNLKWARIEPKPQSTSILARIPFQLQVLLKRGVMKTHSQTRFDFLYHLLEYVKLKVWLYDSILNARENELSVFFSLSFSKVFLTHLFVWTMWYFELKN